MNYFSYCHGCNVGYCVSLLVLVWYNLRSYPCLKAETSFHYLKTNLCALPLYCFLSVILDISRLSFDKSIFWFWVLFLVAQWSLNDTCNTHYLFKHKWEDTWIFWSSHYKAHCSLQMNTQPCIAVLWYLYYLDSDNFKNILHVYITPTSHVGPTT
jgi:hypothetical protein